MTGAGRVWLVDKPVGPTSHDIVAAIRRQLPRKTKVGHAGTLDPFASGLLLILGGGSTRLARYLVGLDKTYEARVRLGAVSTTGDPEGTVQPTGRVASADRLGAVIQSLTGVQEQRVHAFSAVQVGGERLYAIARRGDTVPDVPAREIVVHSLEVTDQGRELDWLDIRVHCSSGTYIRTLAEDIGDGLGCGGYCERLRRTAIGIHRVERALTPDAVNDDNGIPPVTALTHLAARALSPEHVFDVRHGRAIPVAEGDLSPLALLDGRDLIGIGAVDGDLVRPEVVFP